MYVRTDLSLVPTIYTSCVPMVRVPFMRSGSPNEGSILEGMFSVVTCMESGSRTWFAWWKPWAPMICPLLPRTGRGSELRHRPILSLSFTHDEQRATPHSRASTRLYPICCDVLFSPCLIQMVFSTIPRCRSIPMATNSQSQVKKQKLENKGSGRAPPRSPYLKQRAAESPRP